MGALTATGDERVGFTGRLVAIYGLALTLFGGLIRGEYIPLFRPIEVIQLALMGIMFVHFVRRGVAQGRPWRLSLGRHEWWLIATCIAGSLAPMLWLMVRGRPAGMDEFASAMPLVKYPLLYFFVRLGINSAADVRALIRAVLAGSVFMSFLAVAQGLGIGPITAVVAQIWPADVSEIEAGRGTTTLGSPIATGALLAMSLGLVVGLLIETRRKRWLAVAAVIVLGIFGSGQAGSLIASMTVLAVVAAQYGRLARVLTVGAIVGPVVGLLMWPVFAARLDNLDPGSGLPSSWVIRYTNVTQLYLPELLDGGWFLGVSPIVYITPPDAWRDTVFLESGYLWMLWVGGVPLLVAATGYLISAFKRLRLLDLDTPTQRVVRGGALGATSLILLMSIIDPHLTLRGGADLFFILVPAALFAHPLVVPGPDVRALWRERTRPVGPWTLTTARLQFAEVGGQLDQESSILDPELISSSVHQPLFDPDKAETTFVLVVVDADRVVAGSRVQFERHGSQLRACVVNPVITAYPDYEPLMWRALAIIADSLRCTSLVEAGPDGGPDRLVTPRATLRYAAHRARAMERERVSSWPSAEHRSSGWRPTPPIRIEPSLPSSPVRRLVEGCLAVALLVVTAPVFGLCALAVRLSSPGPILYRQIRIGRGGVPFQILKFRTMYTDNDDSEHREQNKAELEGAAGFKDAHDPRITPAGRFLRKTSLDELPQLINIARGEMAVVGPRPSLPWEVELFESWYRRRMQVLPGLTGLWQSTGRGDTGMREMLELDLVYLDERSVATDIRCVANTLKAVVAGEGAR